MGTGAGKDRRHAFLVSHLERWVAHGTCCEGGEHTQRADAVSEWMLWFGVHAVLGLGEMK